MKVVVLAKIPAAIAILAMALFNLTGIPYASAEVLIGVAAPLTGQAVFRGEQVQNGAQKAVLDVNQKGGILGEQVKLVSVDDACDPAQAVAVANKLVHLGIKLVVGHVCSHSSIPASEIYQSAGIVMISPASTHPELTDKMHSNIFRVCGRDDQQGRIAGKLLAKRWPDKRIAIIHDGTIYGRGLSTQTKRTMNELGKREAVFQQYTPGKSEYADLVEGLLEIDAEVIYIGGYPAEAGLIVREFHNRGGRPQFVGGDAITTEEYWLVTGKAGEGTLVTFSDDPRRKPHASSLVKQFRAQGFEPAGYTLHAYTAVQVWAEAVSAAGTFDTNEVTTQLRKRQYQTALGTIGFDKKGDIIGTEFVWYVWKNGDYQPVE